MKITTDPFLIEEIRKIQSRILQEEEDFKLAKKLQEEENLKARGYHELQIQRYNNTIVEKSSSETNDDCITDTILILDTNILLLEKDIDVVNVLNKYTTFIPFAVIKELEKHKYNSKLRKYATHICKVIENEKNIKKNKKLHIQEMVDLYKKCNDEEILRYALEIAHKFKSKKVILVTNDRALRLKSRAYENILNTEQSLKRFV